MQAVENPTSGDLNDLGPRNALEVLAERARLTGSASGASNARLWTTAKAMPCIMPVPRRMTLPAGTTRAAPIWCAPRFIGANPRRTPRRGCRFTDMAQWHGFCIAGIDH
jgi:hypothetical protein